MDSSRQGDKHMLSVSLEDGSVAQYVLRGLKEDEIKSWAQFCASIFAYKANPPPSSYFERHYYNDPNRDPSLVRVMIYNGKVISSCRIFQRQVSACRDASVQAGGIGEVCTDANHRKRGLSKILLQDAIEIMISRGMKLSLLHAAPAFFPVYERSGGYECVTSPWSVISVDRSKLNKVSSPFHIRPAEFPMDMPRLKLLHQQYSELRFVGCIVRSEAYWNDYISKELDGSLWTLVRQEDNLVVAWLSVRERGERYQLREFGCDINAISVSKAASLLLTQALENVKRDPISLHLPTPVLEEIQEKLPPYMDWETLVSEDDHGWMYKTLQTDQRSISDLAKDHPHLIWPADAF